MTLIAQPQVHQWTRREYRRMAAMGMFEGRRVELIEGQVIDMAAMKSPHAASVDLAAAALTLAFGPDYYIRQQKPIIAGDISEPEPDVAVIRGSIRDFAAEHPREADLIVEVADTSLSYDRGLKLSLYAKVGILDYWIINLADRQLEVYREAQSDPEAAYGFSYGEKLIYRENQSATPLAAPKGSIAVNDLLP